MSKAAAAMLLLCLGALAGCSSSHAVLPNCGYQSTGALDGGGIWTCPGNMTCGYSGLGPDGLCHGVDLVCAIPCEASTDCAEMGSNSICSSACGSPVCTPYQ